MQQFRIFSFLQMRLILLQNNNPSIALLGYLELSWNEQNLLENFAMNTK